MTKSQNTKYDVFSVSGRERYAGRKIRIDRATGLFCISLSEARTIESHSIVLVRSHGEGRFGYFRNSTLSLIGCHRRSNRWLCQTETCGSPSFGLSVGPGQDHETSPSLMPRLHSFLPAYFKLSYDEKCRLISKQLCYRHEYYYYCYHYF